MIFHVINLDRSPERWDYMARMCAERGLTARRVPAIDAANLSPAAVEALSPPVEGLRRLAITEIACFESHKAAWRLIADGSDPFGCVLEDDVYLMARIKTFCDSAVRACPDLDLVKLNNYEKKIYYCQQPLAEIDGIRLHRARQRTIDGSAYLISRDCARRALKAFPSYAEELDILLFDPALFVVAQAVPAVSVQEKFADFRFLDVKAAESTLELTRAEVQAKKRDDRRREQADLGRFILFAKAAAELRRFRRRRLTPLAVAIANPFRPAEERISHGLVKFTGREAT